MITAMNTVMETLVLLLPLAGGVWAAWSLPRWAGEGRLPAGERDAGWGTADLPSRPFSDLRHVS